MENGKASINPTENIDAENNLEKRKFPKILWRENKPVSYSIQNKLYELDQNGGVRSEYTTTAVLNVKFLEINGNAIHSVMHLDNVDVQKDGQRFPLVEEMLERYVSYVDFDITGEVKDIVIGGNIAEEDAMSLKEVLNFGVYIPSGKETNYPARWAHEERFEGEISLFEYTQKSNFELIKKRKKYLKHRDDLKLFEVIVKNSDYLISLGDNWLNSFKGSETVQINLDGEKAALFQKEAHLSLTKYHSDEKIDGVDMLDRMSTINNRDNNKDIVSASAWEQERKNMMAESFKNVSYEQIMMDFKKVVNSAASHQDSLRAIDALSQWIESEEGRAARVAEEIKKGLQSPKLSARIIHALELSGNSHESQVALKELFEDSSLPDIIREQAIIAASGIGENIDGSVVDALVLSAKSSDSNTLGTTPLLNLGALAESSPIARNALIENFEPNLNHPENVSNEVLAATIDAFNNGNVASSHIENSVLKIHESSQSEEVKIAALEYLSEAADFQEDIYMNAIEDASIKVQKVAIESIFKDPAKSGIAVDYALDFAQSTKSSDFIRMEIIQNITENIPNYLDYSASLEKISMSTPSPQVRAMVDLALQGKPLSTYETR